jgi:hypothetical protein
VSDGEKMTVPPEAGKWNVSCPECGCDLTIDAATGQVLFHKPAKRQPAAGQDFDQLLAGLDDSKRRADEVFQREVSALKDRDRLMEEKFREAVRRAEEDPDQEPPPRPWELD